MKRFISLLVVFSVGVIVGGTIFSKSIPRSIIALPTCTTNCFDSAQIAGLMMSAGMQISPKIIPKVIAESDKCIAIEHWKPMGRYHVVFFPKRDVRTILELTEADTPYLLDCLAFAQKHMSDAGFENYRFHSNGPGYQHVGYFHFHVVSR